MTKLAHVERERAIGMLKANVTPFIVAKQFRCPVRTIGHFKNRFQQIGTTSHSLRPGCRLVLMRHQDRATQTSHLCNRFLLESVTARTSQGTHNPKIRDQTGELSFQKICLRPPPANVCWNLTLVQYLRQIKEPAVVPTS